MGSEIWREIVKKMSLRKKVTSLRKIGFGNLEQKLKSDEPPQKGDEPPRKNAPQKIIRNTPQEIHYEKYYEKKKIAAPEFRIWSPTTLLGQALSSLTTVDRTGNGAFC